MTKREANHIFLIVIFKRSVNVTNIEKVKAMNSEELSFALMCPAEFDSTFDKIKHCLEGRTCRDCVKAWLESEAEG